MARNQQTLLLLGQKAFAWNLFSDQVGEKASLRTSGGYCLFFLSTKRRLRKSRKCLRRKGNGRRRGNTDMLSLSQSTQRTQRCCQRKSVWFFFIVRNLFGSTSPTIIFSLNGRLIGVLAHWFSLSDKEKLQNLSHLQKRILTNNYNKYLKDKTLCGQLFCFTFFFLISDLGRWKNVK